MANHQVLFIALSVVLAGITSGRAAWKLGEAWVMSLLDSHGRRDLAPRDFMTGFSAIVAMVLAGFASAAAIERGGELLGLVAVILTMPAVGFVWIFGVGANKVVERLLNGIDVKLSK